ncbi:MAG TPA: tetratricopeptide repeat protein [Pyrinomonadaceae bacterium]|nr:tetratricopeptide repeat protein [Pyrinomonadaceae bacterium]
MSKDYYGNWYLLSRTFLSRAGHLVKASALLVAAFAVAGLSASLDASRGVAIFAAQSQTPSTSKPNIANEVEGGEKKNGEKKNGEKETTKPPKPVREQGPRRRPVPPLEVTFTTDVPEAEIFLSLGGMNRQSLGKTDTDGKLTTRLPRGTHNVSASRAGHRIQSQQIEVRPGSTSFAFKLSLPPPPTTADAEKAEEKTTPAPTPDTADEVSTEKALAAADEVLRRYLDAKESENVTKDEWQRTLTQVSAALAKEPDNSQLKARSFVAQGQLAFLGSDYAGALISFNKAAQESTDLAAAHYGRGTAYLATNQPVEAFKAYQRAATVNSELGLAYKGMGDALTRQGKEKEANQYYGRARSAGGLPASVGLVSARALKKQKRWSQALKEFQELSATQPSAELYVDIGDCYIGLEQPLSASQAYRKAAELDPKSALSHYKYGEVMFNLREYAAAADALETSLALDLTGTSINRKRAREMANKAAEKVRKMD